MIHVPDGANLNILLQNFLEGYDYLSWVNRVALYDTEISQPDFSKEIESASQLILGPNGPALTISHIVNAAKLEVHFTAYHSTESLFGLLFAFVYQPDAPWIWLTKYQFDEFNELVSRLAKDGLALFGSDEEQVAKALFFNSKDPTLQNAIDHSAKFTATYVKALAKEFQDKADYNSYKHGLRTLIPQEFRAQLGQQLKQIEWAELVTSYLVLKKPVRWKNQWVSDLELVFRALDYERSKRIIVTNTHLMHNLFEIKKALTSGKSRVTLCLFDSDNVYDILRPSKEGHVMQKMTISPGELT
jgi:hypothetical protein